MKNWTKKKIQKGWERLRPQEHHSKLERNLRLAATGLILFVLASAVFLFFYTIVLLFSLPNPGELNELNLTESTLIMDREGNLLYAIHGEENRNSLDSLSDISPLLIDATIAIEDDGFYGHFGIDIPAIIKAVLSEIGIGSPRGGSTITQQFVKNTFLSSEITYRRKFKEILLSLLVEVKFSKDEILLMYLNAIPYGSNAYGVELAANRYFDKEAVDLTLGESAILASIPKAPTKYSPYGNYRYTTLHFELTEDNLNGRTITGEEDLEYDEWTRGLIGKTFELPDGSTFYIKGRSDLVLDRMLELDMIDQKEHDDALVEIQSVEFTPYRETIEAPHFVLWVKQMLEEKFGAPVVEQGGLKVYTTLDPDFQEAAEKAIADRKDSNMTNYAASDAAMISVQPNTGQILAMVGSADYFDDEIDGQVNIITSSRQPGSSFKPFIYALAFLNQYSPATVLYDVPTRFGTDRPNNYDGEFLGPISIRTALALSRNIPAAKAYFLAGQELAIVPFVKSFGVDSLNENGNYGWPLALGAAELTPLELAEAYGVFANGGYHVDLNPILKIENAEGEILEQWEEKDIEKSQVLDEQVAFLINDILSDPTVNLGPNVRVDSIDNAAKTGTSNKKLSNGNILPNNTWLAAYTPSLVTITWAGNANGDPMNYAATGYSTAAPIWKTFISNVIDRLEPTSWNRPPDIKDVAISSASGKLPSEFTPSDMIKTEVFASFAVPTEIDDAYAVVDVESITNRLATVFSPEDVVEEKTFRVYRSILADIWPSWQEDIDAWLAGKGEENETPPTEYADDIHNERTSANKPNLTIIDPLSLSSISVEDKLVEVDVEILDEGNGVKEVTYAIDDIVVFHAEDGDFAGKVRIPTTAKEGDILTITAKIIDVYGYSGTSSIQVRIGGTSNDSGDE